MHMNYPLMVIILCKYDLDSTYRCMHTNAASAAKFICMTTICALIYLWLTFRGSSSPAEWCILIEIITDLAKNITKSPYWCHTKAYAKELDPSQIPPAIILPPSNKFVQALPADVHLSLPRHGWIDSYIDDMIGIFIHMGYNTVRTTKSILLALYVMACPSSPTPPPILHKYLLSIINMIVEDR